MNEFQLLILAGAALTALFARKLPHAWLWISLGTVNAVACSTYYHYNLPYPVAFALACDALMCLTIHWLAKERWERGLFVIFQFSVLVSVGRLMTIADILVVIADEETYKLATELCLWAALAMISGTAILGGASGRFFRSAWTVYVLRAYRYLRSPPATAHWRQARR